MKITQSLTAEQIMSIGKAFGAEVVHSPPPKRIKSYKYNPQTGEFLGVVPAILVDGKYVYEENATWKKPPMLCSGRQARFIENGWKPV